MKIHFPPSIYQNSTPHCFLSQSSLNCSNRYQTK